MQVIILFIVLLVLFFFIKRKEPYNGALVQLYAKGPQDVYLTGWPYHGYYQRYYSYPWYKRVPFYYYGRYPYYRRRFAW